MDKYSVHVPNNNGFRAVAFTLYYVIAFVSKCLAKSKFTSSTCLSHIDGALYWDMMSLHTHTHTHTRAQERADSQQSSLTMLENSPNLLNSLCTLDRLPSRYCNTVFVLYLKEGLSKPEDILLTQVDLCACF